MKTLAATAAALVCAAAIASPALAEGNGRALNVHYQTSDLLTPESAAGVEAEIRAAAKKVCIEPGMRGVARRTTETACRIRTEREALDGLSVRVAEARRAAGRTSLAAVN